MATPINIIFNTVTGDLVEFEKIGSGAILSGLSEDISQKIQAIEPVYLSGSTVSPDTIRPHTSTLTLQGTLDLNSIDDTRTLNDKLRKIFYNGLIRFYSYDDRFLEGYCSNYTSEGFNPL